MMRFKMSLFLLLFFGSLVSSLTAQNTASGLVALTDGSITLFANGTATPLADIPAELPIEVDEAAGFEYSLSNDHQWLMQTSYWPAVVAYGRMGEPMTVVPFEDGDMSYYVLSASFSPDNRFLIFTIAESLHWRMGIVTLESGDVSTFESEFAAYEPDLSPDLPFGNMVPINPVWSTDGTRLYLETMIPFWGCRGPHDLYAIDMDESDFAPSMPLPSTTEIARQGTDVYTIAFSPDRSHVAYVFEDESCSYAGARGLALTALSSDTDEVLVKGDEAYYVDIIGWPEADTLLYSRTVRDEMEIAVPTLYLHDMATGEAVELPALSEDPDDLVVKLAARGESLLFTLADKETYNPSYPTVLYHRALTDDTPQVIADSVFDWMVCGDTLYYETSAQGSSVALFSQSLASFADEPRELWTAKTMWLVSCSEVAAQEAAPIATAEATSVPTQETKPTMTHEAASGSTKPTSRIAFVSDRGDSLDIYTMAPDGSDVRQLTDSEHNDLAPQWSPDGTQIAFLSDRKSSTMYGLYLMNADGTNQRALLDDGSYTVSVVWSPDGQWIAFASDTIAVDGFDLYVMNVASREVTFLRAGVRPVGWSPDGTQIVIEAGGKRAIKYLLDPETKGIRVIKRDDAIWYDPNLSPNGTYLMTMKISETVDHTYDIFVTNLVTQETTLVKASTQSPEADWSPDGTQIVFVGSASRFNEEVYIINFDGTDERRLTDAEGYDYYPKWSPWLRVVP